MKNSKTILLTITVILVGFINLRGQIRISGFVKDSITKEVLVGSHIVEYGTNNATITDNNGYFSLITEKGSSVSFSFVGYQLHKLNLTGNKDTIVHIFLNPGNTIDEVVVRIQKKPIFNVSTLSNKELQFIPSLGAKPDVLKTLQMLPGIQSQNEGSSLLMVRGGNPGENLYLIDNVPLIYVNHLGGFMSVFNPDMINNVNVYKGGFPARYGGKLSSIVDIAQKDGDKSGLKGSYSFGITDFSFALEGPFLLKNSTFIITGRKTFTDLLLALASSLSEGDYIASYGFHDINAKFSWKPDEKNSFHLNFYQGDDYLNYWSSSKSEQSDENSHITNIWGNWLLSGRWNRVISPRLYTSNILSYTRYRLKDKQTYTSEGIDLYNYKMEYISSVQDLSYRSDWKYEMIKKWKIDYGLQFSFLQHSPNDNYQSTLPVQQEKITVNTLETSIYLENKIKLIGETEAIIGLRGTNNYTHSFSDFSIEPRINLNVFLTKNHSLNFNYQKVTQYAHLLFTAGSIMSNEVWVPAGLNTPPARSEQFSAGWHGNFIDEMFQIETNIYYKKLSNLATYREGYTNLIGDANWLSKVETGGIGEAMGAELFIRKNYGKWTGFVSYSWAKSTRQYANINQGAEYLFEYDRPHSGSVSINHKLSDKWALNIAWIYSTGLPYTPVIGRQYTPDLDINVDGVPFNYEAYIYGERNSARMRDYHRLDIAFNYTTLTKRRKMKAQWSFAIYNLYNRRNPYYYYLNESNTAEFPIPSPDWPYKPVSLYQVSFFPIMPTISYKVFFEKDKTKQKEKLNGKEKLKRWLIIAN